jgi:membrane protein implicated in regulation of membrane protease activity
VSVGLRSDCLDVPGKPRYGGAFLLPENSRCAPLKRTGEQRAVTGQLLRSHPWCEELPAKISPIFAVHSDEEAAMPWWGWFVMAAALLAIELFVIDAQFYLVFLGVSAALVGLIDLADGTMPAWEQWLAFAVLSIVTMLAFRDRVYQLVRKRTGHVEQRLTLGDRVLIPVRLEPGQSCRTEYRGSSWTARNVDQQTIDAGKEAVIAHVDGLTLHVRGIA